MPWTHQISVERDLVNYSPLFPVPDGYWLCEWSCERKKEKKKNRGEAANSGIRENMRCPIPIRRRLTRPTPLFDAIWWAISREKLARQQPMCRPAGILGRGGIFHSPAFKCLLMHQRRSGPPMTSCTLALFSPLFQPKAKPTFLNSKVWNPEKAVGSWSHRPLLQNVSPLDLRCEPCGGIAGRAGSWTTTQLSCTKLTFCSVFSLNL